MNPERWYICFRDIKKHNTARKQRSQSEANSDRFTSKWLHVLGMAETCQSWPENAGNIVSDGGHLSERKVMEATSKQSAFK